MVSELQRIAPAEVLRPEGSLEQAATSPLASALLGDKASRLSCAVVGSAPTLLRARLGAVIDSFDVVVRTNFAPSELGRYRPHVGSRTDVRSMSGEWVELGARAKGTLLLHPTGATAGGRKANANYSVLVVGKEIEEGFSHGALKFPVSAGMRALLVCLRLCGSVSLFGFDLDGSAPGHYYDDETEGVVPALLALANAEPSRFRIAPHTLSMGDGRNPLFLQPVTAQGGRVRAELRHKPGVRPGLLNEYVRANYASTDLKAMRFRHNFGWERIVARALARAGCLSAQPWRMEPNRTQAALELIEARTVRTFREMCSSGDRRIGCRKPVRK